MATLAELKTEIANDSTFNTLDQAAWETKIKARGLQFRSAGDLEKFVPQYVRQITEIRQKLRGDWNVTIRPQNSDGTARSAQDIIDDLTEELGHLTSREIRITDKLACVLQEQYLRDNSLVTRAGLHDYEYYYLDYTGGSDSAAGTRWPTDIGDGGGNGSIDSVSTNDLTDAALDGETITAGDYIYNVTRSDSTTVSSWDDPTDTITCAKDIQTAGWAATDAYYLIRAWKTFDHALEIQARSAGDIVYCRANITWTQGTEAVDVEVDEAGTLDSYITIQGCDSTTDPWEDASDVKPIIDFEDLSYQMKFAYGHDFWKVLNLELKRSADGAGCLSVASVYGMLFEDIKLHDNNGVMNGISLSGAEVVFDTLEILDTGGTSIYSSASFLTVKNSTMNGGAVNQASHALGITGGRCIIEDTSIGVTTGYGTNVLEYYTGMVVVCRNVTWGGTGPNGPSTTQRSAEVFTEDDDGTFEDHEAYYRAGTITRDTATTRSGGADSSSKMEPSAACGPNDPLILGEPLWGFAAIWATASVQINISVWARVGSAWDTALTAAECYAKFSYLSNAGNATRTQVDSTETINNAGTWTALTSGNITPSRTGWVYIWFYLEEYEDATEHVLVDILPTVS